MFFTIATDRQRITLATDGALYGQAVYGVEEEKPFDIHTGIGAAIMNMYLALPEKPKYSLEMFPAYYLVCADPAYLLRYMAGAIKLLPNYDRGLIARSWGEKLVFEIVSIASDLKEIRQDQNKVLTGDWRWDPISETRQ